MKSIRYSRLTWVKENQQGDFQDFSWADFCYWLPIVLDFGKYRIKRLSKNAYLGEIRKGNYNSVEVLLEDRKIQIVERQKKENENREGFIIKMKFVDEANEPYSVVGDYAIITKRDGLRVKLTTNDKVGWLYVIDGEMFISSYEEMLERFQVADEIAELWEEEEGN